ncbi:unnamed protein product [Prorocentrum cordatum]|uniref:Inositol-pentakisphosphate 2-kinase n=1 Tax=Prorocentrum cordatum TaxID=2364126 RepID=A0ABN9Y3W7_9DINO|nr:unnamed protein product [Polarella glacialis]
MPFDADRAVPRDAGLLSGCVRAPTGQPPTEALGEKPLQDPAAIPDIHIRLLYKSVELRAGKLVDNYVMDGGFEAKFPIDLQYLIIDQGHARGPKSQKDMGLCVDSQVPCPPRLRSLVADCLLALRRGIQPRLTDEGTGATYMLRDPANKSNLAVFKPKAPTMREDEWSG